MYQKHELRALPWSPNATLGASWPSSWFPPLLPESHYVTNIFIRFPLIYPEVYMKMMCTAKKCRIRFQPPAVILIYENEMKGKSLQCIMPVQNFSKLSDCNRAAEQLKNNSWYKSYPEQVSLRQLEKLFSFLRGYLLGQNLAETMEQIQRKTSIDPEEDMN